ncbi:hypothetical protein EN873_04960 [bacterium M00.F.Ca.ET.230.01.1.1]|nr:hypothetical protein EN873_04960 [bacterium M00.F.Ca.ET.230.01.1.1]
MGGSSGVTAGLGATVGGPSTLKAGAGAALGGAQGVTAGLGATVGGPSTLKAGAGTTLGSGHGVTAGLGATVGDTDTIDPGTGDAIVSGLAPSGGVGTRLSRAIDPSTSQTTTNPRTANIVAGISGEKLVRMKKRCVDVLSSQDAYDRDLRQLCQLIAGR